MASAIPLIMEEHLSCPICSEIFRNPVVLQCSHSFCQECLQQRWDNAEEDARCCPVCSKECSSDEPRLSIAFKNLCESLLRQNEIVNNKDICPQHGERLKLFCMDDKEPICVVCHTSKKHRGHECYPTEEAVAQLKGEIECVVSNLKSKLDNIKSANKDYQSWRDHIKGQAQHAEEWIRTVFKELHRFLDEEEAARLLELQEEEERKCRVMDEKIEFFTRRISALSETFQEMKTETEMEVEDIPFLQNYKAVCDRAESIPWEPSDAQLVSGAFIDMAKHIGSLKYKVGKKMLQSVNYTAVTMDPNTACNKLQVTDDLTCVTYCEDKQDVPNNPERFHVGVLGSEGYSQGCYYWDVDVGDGDNWTLGVVKESINRKKLFKMDGRSGVWSIRYVSGKYRAGVKSRLELKVDENPNMIRVMLDCDKGEVKFFDLTNKKDLYAFKDEEFTEKVFPYFSCGSLTCPMRLCQVPMFLPSVA